MSGIRRSLALLIVATVLTACGSSEPEQSPTGEGAGDLPEEATLSPLAGGEPELDTQILETADPRETPLPLQAYAPSDEAVKAMSRARILIGDECMARFGFRPLPDWQPSGADPLLTWNRYGLWDVSAAAEQGYQQPLSPTANPAPIRFLEPGATDVYLGDTDQHAGQKVPEGGCQGEELRALYGPDGVGEDVYRVNDLANEALTRATQDSRVTPLLDEWRECMSGAGWDFPDPRSPFNHWSTRRGDDKKQPVVSEEEKRSALADIECKESTGLLGTWLAADVAYQHAIIERDGEQLREFTSAVDERVGRANDILAQG